MFPPPSPTAPPPTPSLPSRSNATAMSCSGDSLYIVCGKAGGCSGGGGLYRVSTSVGTFVRLGDADWSNVTTIATQ